MSDRSVWRLEDEIDQLRDEVTRLRLTDEEREAVLSCAIDDEAASAFQRADILRGLLERLGGGR